MSADSPKIDLLPEHLIDQIKAGEVIERPGNLIKEILENAVDAGAYRLELTVKNNGLDLISLKDNGHGIRFEDLPLAFSRHATSKISRFEDLYRLHSFGFRGEALASIAAISRLQCISKTAVEASAGEIRINGGETVFLGQRQASSAPTGTEFIVQDLFFNTPARLKFIQSGQSEKNFIKRIIYAFILSRPEIEFQIKIEDTEKEIFPARESLLDRIKDIFPKAQENIVRIQKFYENIELELFLIPGPFKGPFRVQNIFINHRYILDKQLHRVMANGLESVLGTNDYHYVGLFHLPPDAIDVNVHPNKTIIKVMENSKMLSLLTSTIKELTRKKTSAEAAPHISSSEPASFLDDRVDSPVLQQERHQYNMEGLFSPHRLPVERKSDLIWIDEFFLRRSEDRWLTVLAPKLLEEYTKKRLSMMAPTIPLLVSEPYPAKDIKKEALKFLADGGAELEYLGAETLVLRGIPDWMNGFPLKDVMSSLLLGRSFSEIKIHPPDWSESTWIQMLEFFPVTELISKKIVIDLSTFLRERLR